MNFWQYLLIQNGINTGITALSYIVNKKIGNPELQAAAQAAIEALHNFLDVWQMERTQGL